MTANISRSFQSSAAKAPRIFTSANKREVVPEELNQLFVKVGQPLRNLDKLNIALQHSFLCITARLIGDQTLVGFVRVSGDGVFNATVWDFVVDPSIPNREDAKAQLILRLKREIKRTLPHCAVSMFANPQDLHLLSRANFAEDEKGIRAMGLR